MQEPLTNRFSVIPRHIAIIMDGNGRWAKQHGLPRVEGHRRGVINVENILQCASEINLEVLTLFAFSSENWNRPREEVDALMNLLSEFLTIKEPLLHKNQVRLRMIGRKQELPARVVEQLEQVESRTSQYPRTLALALNYGSRVEAVDAARKLIAMAQAGALDPAALDWDTFSRCLYTSDLPDPDLVIRTSGESRLSNFLLLQAAYAEIIYSPLNWPDFDRKAFAEALENFQNGERRYGMASEQIASRPRPL